MADQQQGRVALVTGAAGGLGRVMVRALLADGHRIAAVDRDGDRLSALCRDLAAEGAVVPVEADVGREPDCRRAVDEAVARLGRVDILVNNAGIGPSHVRPDAEINLPTLDELTPELWERFFAVNVHGPLYLTRAAVPQMQRNGWGRVVNNTTSFFTMLRILPYGSAKAALESMSAVLAKQLDGTGITVNVLVPGGPTDTAFIADEAGWDRGKMIRPEVMGPPIRWLCSTAADTVTGRRVTAALWDASLAHAAAAPAATSDIGWPELAAATVVWLNQ